MTILYFLCLSLLYSYNLLETLPVSALYFFSIIKHMHYHVEYFFHPLQLCQRVMPTIYQSPQVLLLYPRHIIPHHLYRCTLRQFCHHFHHFQ